MIGQNPPVYIMQVYTVLIHTKPLLRDGKGNGEHNTSYQHVDLEKSARKQKLLSSPSLRSKHFKETSDVDTDTTLTGGFAAMVVIMLLIYGLKVQGHLRSGRKG